MLVGTAKILSVAGCLLAIAACGATPERPSAVAMRERVIRPRADQEIPQLLSDYNVSSVSIGHIEAGQVAFVHAYGLQAPGISATNKTLYNIASLSKPLSAEVVLRLASQGRVTLDEPMYRYWTDPDIANDERRKLLTPRLAMSHQTGFPNWRRQTGHVLTFRHAPGEVYGYSGEGYEYLARFAEKKTNTDFETLAQDLVLGPIAMTETAYTRRPWFEDRIAVPTDGQGQALEPEIADHWIASDMIYTTASDYSKFMLSVMRGEGFTKAIASERSRVQAVEGKVLCSAPKPAGCPEEAGFGLGWEIIKLGGDTYMTHNGSDEGIATFVYINLTRHTGTVILTNSANGGKIVLPILDLLGQDQAFVSCLRRQAC